MWNTVVGRFVNRQLRQHRRFKSARTWENWICYCSVHHWQAHSQREITRWIIKTGAICRDINLTAYLANECTILKLQIKPFQKIFASLVSLVLSRSFCFMLWKKPNRIALVERNSVVKGFESALQGATFTTLVCYSLIFASEAMLGSSRCFLYRFETRYTIFFWVSGLMQARYTDSSPVILSQRLGRRSSK